ncbi:MAG: relaxase domain-containing protein [Boseongicola sp. SB0677_bin_26]|nr:relaxase domain-containing protein [Boseongicola sp. SB0665_bin_10]MYG26207.1 relaxase domain-containing protein [Boseongicola sp. SB0677_bin_26]
MGLSGPVDPERFRSVLKGEVPGGRRLGRREINGNIVYRPGCDVTLSAPKSVSLMALVGGDERIVETHDRAVTATLDWIEEHAVETRMRDPATRAMKGFASGCNALTLRLLSVMLRFAVRLPDCVDILEFSRTCFESQRKDHHQRLNRRRSWSSAVLTCRALYHATD